MRIRWWQSIRWRLALGSMLVAFLATALLALIVIISVPYFYGVDQQNRLTTVATSSTERIGKLFAEQSGTLAQASASVLDSLTLNSQGGDYLTIVLNSGNRPVYPRYMLGRRALVNSLLGEVDPALRGVDYTRVHNAMMAGLQGTAVTDELGDRGPTATPRPFEVRPIFYNGQSGATVVGVLFITPRSAIENTVPPFVATVSRSILIASALIAVIAAGAAILFSRTITRPLARLTKATRVLASGNYSERVQTGVHGELGELARNFNDMASQLERDVAELHKQELWRRELIMNVTHDLATPLTAIAGLGESLVDGVNSGREDYEVTGRIIVRETLRLRRLVKDLHMMAKVEAGALRPQRTTVRLATLVDDVFAVLTPEFERHNVEPRNLVAYDLPALQGDPDMLTRVFSNLCDNALHHTPPGGIVQVEARLYSKMMMVAITDTGKGIPAEALPRVFDRFYRADTARQENTGGSGLGLAIVRAIIEAHGGEIRAENAPNAGARILFTLPLL